MKQPHPEGCGLSFRREVPGLHVAVLFLLVAVVALVVTACTAASTASRPRLRLCGLSEFKLVELKPRVDLGSVLAQVCLLERGHDATAGVLTDLAGELGLADMEPVEHQCGFLVAQTRVLSDERRVVAGQLSSHPS